MEYLERRVETLKNTHGRLIFELPIITDTQGQLYAQADYWKKLAELLERQVTVLQAELRDANELLDMVEPVALVKRLREKLHLRTRECERLLYSRASGAAAPHGLGLKVTGKFKADDLGRRMEFAKLLREVNIPCQLTPGQRRNLVRLREWSATPYVTIRELAIRDKCTEGCYRNKLLTSRAWLLNLLEEQRCKSRLPLKASDPNNDVCFRSKNLPAGIRKKL